LSLKNSITKHLGVAPVGIQHVYIESGALSRLPQVLSKIDGLSSIALLIDESEYCDQHEKQLKPAVIKTLEEIAKVKTVLLHGEVHADENTVAQAVLGCDGTDVVVTFGSGTLCDIGKVAAGNRPHIVIQSAASVNGFADDQSVLLIKGTKRTTHSSWPHTLIVDNQVLAGAPKELNCSGLGDMISMFTAPADWYLSSIFGMDRGFDIETAAMTRSFGENLLQIAGGVGESDSTALNTLAEFLTLSGISMGVAGQTSPSSGMEHTVSHLIDMSNGSKGKPNAFHGEQVGISTVMVSLLWNKLLKKIRTNSIAPLTVPDSTSAEAAVRNAFDWMDESGATASECWADYSLKRSHLADSGASQKLADAIGNWGDHQATLDDLLLEPERIISALREAGAPTRFRDLSQPVDAETVKWALLNCHLMRNRFTIADLAYLTGNWNLKDVEELLEEAESLGSGI
jgi:glycerol-1-phosphate dehydrogenase [NAD(P)+]